MSSSPHVDPDAYTHTDGTGKHKERIDYTRERKRHEYQYIHYTREEIFAQ